MSSLPAYEPLQDQHEAEPRTMDDALPDDFKWSDVVAECTVDIRQRFVQRVFAILVGQLLLTAAVGYAVVATPGVREYVLSRTWTIIVSFVGSFAAMVGAMFMARRYPWNLVLLSIFTVFEGFIVGLVTMMYDSHVVFTAIVLTAVIFTGLACFAWQTKYDFSSMAPYLLAGLLGLMGMGFVLMFVPSSGAELAYSAIAVLIFSGFILVDIQAVQTRYHPDDEVPAAIALYLDIINLFMNLLRLLNNNS